MAGTCYRYHHVGIPVQVVQAGQEIQNLQQGLNEAPGQGNNKKVIPQEQKNADDYNQDRKGINDPELHN